MIDADDDNNAGTGTGLLTVAANVTLTSAAGITLDATEGGITFTGVGTLNAVNGVTINDAVTATAGTLTIDADTDNDGTGTFTTIATGTINSAGQTLDITASDVVIGATIAAATLNITDSDGGGIGLGDTTVVGGLNVSAAELQRITTTTLMELITAGNVTVDNITAANSNTVNTLTIDAVGAITFANNASTFNALTVEADGAVTANANITTDVGALLIDADDDNNAGTGTGLLTVAANVTLTSAAGITLDATEGGITFTGAGTLNAVNGVTINDAVTATAGTLTIDADTDNDGTGTFTTAAGATIDSSAQTLDITAGDVVIGATVAAATLNVSDSDGNGIGLGDTRVGDFQLSGTELQLITTTTLMELITAGGVTVNNISAANSNTVNTLTIDAVGVVRFADNGSAFEALTVEADAGTTIDGVDITSDAGPISFTGNVTVTTGAVVISNGVAGGAGANITFNNDLTLDGTDDGQDLTIIAGGSDVVFTGAVQINTSDIIVASSRFTQLTTGLGGTIGNVNFTTTNRTDVDGAIALTGAGTVTLDAATISGVNVSTSGGNIEFSGAVELDTGAVAIATGAVAGNVQFLSTVSGGQNLALTVAGLTDFQGTVGAAAAIGDGTGAAITINSTGATEFDLTLATASGIASDNNAGAITFRGDVTIAAGDTATTLINAVTNLDGLTFTSAGDVTFGNAVGTDQVNLTTAAVTITTTGTGDDLTFASKVDGGQDLALNVVGATDFQGAVGSVTAIGDGTGAAITINSTGATEFDLTLATASGIASDNNAGAITFRGDVTIAAGDTATTLINAVTNLDGLTFTSAGDVTFGNAAGTDQVNLTTAAVTITTTGAGDDLTFASKVDGGQNLALNVVGATDFQGAVGSVTAIGDGTGAAITINSTGATEFDLTLATASGIASDNDAGAITFRGDVTIAAGDTATTLINAVTNLDGLTFTSAGDVTFGNAAGTDQVNLTTAAVTITTTGAGDDLTFASKVDGGQNLALNVVGATDFQGAVGSVTAIGDGTGAAITINSTGATEFDLTLATASGIASDNDAGAITFRGDVTIAAGDTATTLINAVTNLDGLTFTSAGDVTFGNAAGTDQVNLTTAAVTITTTGTGDDLTFASKVDGGQNLALNVVGATDFQGAVGSVTAIGDGTGAAITINSTGATEFDLTLATASGIASDNNAGAITFRGDVTIAAGDTATTLINAVTNLDGLTFTSAGDVTFGNAVGTDQVNLTTAAVTITTTGTGDDLTFASKVDGGQNLALNVVGATDFQGAVGSVTAIGDGTGAAITINSTGATEFDLTLATASGIASDNNAGAITFRGDVTIAAGDTATTLINAVTNLDGLTFTSAGDVTFGNAVGTDQVNLTTAAVTITTTGTGDDLTFASKVDGGQNLALNVVGATDFQGAVGSVTAIGDGTGAAITINSTGATEFDLTLATASGIASDNNAGAITFRGDVTIAAGDTATTLINAVTNLDGLTFTSASDVTFGNAAGTDQVNLTTAAVTITLNGVGSDLTFTSKVAGAQDLTLAAAGDNIQLAGTLDIGTGNLTISTANVIDAAAVNAATITIGSAASASGLPVTTVNTGAFTSTTTTTIEANTVNAISVTATDARILTANRIINASVTSDTLTVRGGRGVLLINTTIGGASGGTAFQNLDYLKPYFSQQSGGGMRFKYRINGMPFGPEHNAIATISSNIIPLNIMPNLSSPAVGANNSGSILDQLGTSSGKFQAIPFFYDFGSLDFPLVSGFNRSGSLRDRLNEMNIEVVD